MDIALILFFTAIMLFGAIGCIVYLIAHIAVRKQMRRGSEQWDNKDYKAWRDRLNYVFAKIQDFQIVTLVGVIGDVCFIFYYIWERFGYLL